MESETQNGENVQISVNVMQAANDIVSFAKSVSVRRKLSINDVSLT